jgi:ribosome recycling factor
MIKETLDEAKEKFKKLEIDFIKDTTKFRTGRASVSMLDGIMVSYYGTLTPINQVATISTPEANLIAIQPWDHSIINEIEKSIQISDLNINPISDGKIIRLPVPPLDEQRRKEIIKTLKRYTEERKTSVRNIRRDYRELAKLMKDEKQISEDDEKRFNDELQKMVDACVSKLEKIESEKEKHILED